MQGATDAAGRSAAVDFIFDAGADGRYFNFGVLPGELLSSTVVTKSVQSSETKDGIPAMLF